MKRFVLAVMFGLLAMNASAQGTGTWFVKDNPAVNTAATKTQAAAPAGVRNVADCLTATFVAGTTAPAVIQVAVVIRDGATGTGTILAQWNMSLPATAGASAAPLIVCPNGGLGISGSAATAMTVEFTATGGANTFETVTLKGHRERF